MVMMNTHAETQAHTYMTAHATICNLDHLAFVVGGEGQLRGRPTRRGSPLGTNSHEHPHLYIYVYIHTYTDTKGQSWPRGTGSVGDSVGEGTHTLAVFMTEEVTGPTSDRNCASLFVSVCARVSVRYRISSE